MRSRIFVHLTLTLMVCCLTSGQASAQSTEVSVKELMDLQGLLDRQAWDEAIAQSVALLKIEPGNPSVLYGKSFAFYKKGEYEASIEAALQTTDAGHVAFIAWYGIANAYAQLGKADEAFDALDKAILSGYGNYTGMLEDPEFEPLHSDPRWNELPGPFEIKSRIMADEGSILYALVLPDDFDPNMTYPALIGMPPGDGTVGPTKGALNWWWGHQAARAGWIVAVLVRPPTWTDPIGDRYLVEMLDELQAMYNIEGGKFHIAGSSGGGPSAVHAAIRNPQRFHSLTLLPGYPNGVDFNQLVALKDMKVRMYVGALDNNWRREMQRTYETLQTYGCDVTLTISEGEKHYLYSLRGRRLMEKMEALRVKDQKEESGE
ncbi:MAG: hypothetical protein O7G85_09285 [Planctomycetota bacterium]|nr:hypothetical protein [Planctomycetota bacterium]